MKLLATFFLSLIMFLVSSHAGVLKAVYDPLSVDNNRFGVHILDPSEVEEASKLINSNGGEWGYVVIPINQNDRNFDKWYEFFKRCNELKVIPILRLATWVRGDTWMVPDDNEILYFANFLDTMPWPTRNRYVVIFNEPNHGVEWGGVVNPAEYAQKLRLAISIFKSHNDEYFILPAALDKATNDNHVSMSAETFLKQMLEEDSRLALDIDGWNSHAYPNPAFSGKPTDASDHSIVSYRHDLDYLQEWGRKEIPVFITETGWDMSALKDSQIEAYWKQAFSEIWSGNSSLAAVNIWLLRADSGPFKVFSLISGEKTLAYKTIFDLGKEKGNPEVVPFKQKETQPVKSTFHKKVEEIEVKLPFYKRWWQTIKGWFSFDKDDSNNNMPQLMIGNTSLNVELADSPDEIVLGLGHRKSMPEGNGMLFVFDNSSGRSFWMKYTLFPLDMIWINQGQIIGITKDIPVETNPATPIHTYQSPKPADWVLEVNGGWADRNGVKIGDKVIMKK